MVCQTSLDIPSENFYLDSVTDTHLKSILITGGMGTLTLEGTSRAITSNVITRATEILISPSSIISHNMHQLLLIIAIGTLILPYLIPLKDLLLKKRYYELNGARSNSISSQSGL